MQPPDINELYQRYGAMVLRRIRRFYRGDEAEDVLQEVFMRVIDKLDTFRGESSMVTWLYQLTTRYCLNRLRNESRRKELWEEHSDVVYWSKPTSAAGQERTALLGELWRHLDDELITIGIYYHLDGMTHAEIARVVGCSRRTVGNRLEELTRAAIEFGGAK
ncbi:MAG: RNA polymerase sigma factor (sigma-70 family) [Myxococcota bacterium]|jgi:RNA polymerase sigma factor (sigma-70 family)